MDIPFVLSEMTSYLHWPWAIFLICMAIFSILIVCNTLVLIKSGVQPKDNRAEASEDSLEHQYDLRIRSTKVCKRARNLEVE